MPIHVICLKDRDQEYFLEWSTQNRRPMARGMSADGFRVYRHKQYTTQWYRSPGRVNVEMGHLHGTISRAREYGTDCITPSLDDLLKDNQAGKDRTCATQEEILDRYCRPKPKPVQEEPSAT